MLIVETMEEMSTTKTITEAIIIIIIIKTILGSTPTEIKVIMEAGIEIITAEEISITKTTTEETLIIKIATTETSTTKTISIIKTMEETLIIKTTEIKTITGEISAIKEDRIRYFINFVPVVPFSNGTNLFL